MQHVVSYLYQLINDICRPAHIIIHFLSTRLINSSNGKHAASNISQPLWFTCVQLYCVKYAADEMRRYRQMKEERDKLQNDYCQLLAKKDGFMDQCHRLREEIGKNQFLATKTKLRPFAIFVV